MIPSTGPKKTQGTITGLGAGSLRRPAKKPLKSPRASAMMARLNRPPAKGTGN